MALYPWDARNRNPKSVLSCEGIDDRAERCSSLGERAREAVWTMRPGLYHSVFEGREYRCGAEGDGRSRVDGLRHDCGCAPLSCGAERACVLPDRPLRSAEMESSAGGLVTL